ncbi:glucose-6-phosphatase catalytic subunit 1 [Pectinophora gossypiella]|uniref:glucose-6-phosphatase catalytic subunit 1 n=1 Tax=Pectinophora gossypiella TaxID=13191 RepID=UPI00214F441C|nr:glucose-6-phosphatase catalytic subunit 1 [Pectinophora gossypiella]
MEQLYALGVSAIEVIQVWFADYEGYLEMVNDVFNPNHMLEILFPVVSIVDSVFAAQLVLCMAFGNWLNAVMKWWLVEDRPYWWIRETDFYTGGRRPILKQFRQTCETGPGCPSGHSETAAILLILTICWVSHLMNDRKCYVWWWKYVMYPVCAASLLSVMLARLFIAVHFPHQVLAGALVGGFLAPALCIYVTDPYIWQYGVHVEYGVGKTMAWHVASVVTIIAISGVTYYGLVLCGFDPQWTIKLAFRWCESPQNIHVTTTPMFALAHSTGYLLGWALTVTPSVAQYRHYTKSRSLIISAFTTTLIYYTFKCLQDNVNKEHALLFYFQIFLLCALKVPFLLRVGPAVAMLPYSKVKKD